MNASGKELRRFSEAEAPRHLALFDKCHVLVADFVNHNIVHLNCELKQECDFVLNYDSKNVKLWRPTRLCYNNAKSQVYVAYGSKLLSSYFVSAFKLH